MTTGEVVAIGEQVSRVKIGDRVSPIYAQKWLSGVPDQTAIQSTIGSPVDGLLAEYAVLHEEAACLPCAGVTAWHAVVAEGNIKASDTVLVQGTGDVSLLVLQFAKMHGARVIIISSSDEKIEKAKKLGADIGVNYRDTPDWERTVLEYTSGS